MSIDCRFLSSEISNGLKNHGYAVIPNIISQNLADEILSEFQAFHAHATGQQFTDELYDRSLELKNTHGIIEFPGALSHTDFVNRVRNHPNVLQVFSEIYKSSDPILTGFDKINYQASVNMRKLKTRDRKSWWHVDQGWKDPNFTNIQAYVDLVGSETDEHAGLMVLDGSHLHFETLVNMHNNGILKGWVQDWYRLEDTALEYFQSCPVVNVKCPKGGMVLWDSRTVHMSRPNRHETDERFVIYTCGWPKSRLTEKDLKRREEAKRLLRATSAWPDARHIFPAKPQWFQKFSEEPQRVAEQWIRN